MAKSRGLVAHIEEDRRWAIERDMNTLLEAEKIKADPKRLKAAQAMAKEKMMAVAKVAAADKDD